MVSTHARPDDLRAGNPLLNALISQPPAFFEPFTVIERNRCKIGFIVNIPDHRQLSLQHLIDHMIHMRQPGLIVPVETDLIDIKNLQGAMLEDQSEGQLKLRHPGLFEPVIVTQHIPGVSAKTGGLQRKNQLHRRVCRFDADQIPVSSMVHRALLDPQIDPDSAGQTPRRAQQQSSCQQANDRGKSHRQGSSHDAFQSENPTMFGCTAGKCRRSRWSG